MITLDANTTVAQWVAEYPQTADLFERLKIDYCCHGNVSLNMACANRKLDANSLVRDLLDLVSECTNPSSRTPTTSTNWLVAPLQELCDHIEQTHHVYLRDELPRLSERIEKIAAVHGEEHPELHRLAQVFLGLRAELEQHMMKEERILFPAIRQTENALTLPSFPFGTMANPIRMMEHEHENAGQALAQLREITNDYELPDDACNTYRATFDALQRLERDLHEHIHKENYILFPRAQKLEASGQ